MNNSQYWPNMWLQLWARGTHGWWSHCARGSLSVSFQCMNPNETEQKKSQWIYMFRSADLEPPWIRKYNVVFVVWVRLLFVFFFVFTFCAIENTSYRNHIYSPSLCANERASERASARQTDQHFMTSRGKRNTASNPVHFCVVIQVICPPLRKHRNPTGHHFSIVLIQQLW